MQLRQGMLLQGGRYKIERMLGQGGFGITYLALQSGLERKVAIKEFFMREHCERDERTSHVTLGTKGSRDTVKLYRDKFLKEARNIAKLDHPNIVSIIDVFEDNGTAYYVMKYAENGSLADKVKRDRFLSEQVATRYILQIADALAYIHERKMNHLDVKPGNIMLNKNDETILIDFGLSKQYDMVTEGQTSATPVGISRGYAPMEQYRDGGVSEFSPQVDIYSLGATYFKLLTGVNPPSAFDIDDNGLPIEELMKKGVSQAAISVISQAMESRKKDRMADVRLFIKSLTSVTDVVDEDETTTIVECEETVYSDDVLPITVNGVSFNMIKVDGGTFTMGATEEMAEPWDDEKPAHLVILSSYYIGETVVTQALWKAVMGNNPSNFKGDNLPVEKVSWNDCQDFIRKLNDLTNRRFRLPSEAEWEFAARGGNKSNRTQYSGGDNIDDVAWYGGNCGGNTHSVKTKKANELGLYDMSGNVWEWCQDWLGSYGSNEQTNPSGPESGYRRVVRGGSWGYYARCCCSSNRSSHLPNNRDYYLGFRLALSE